TDHPAAKDPYFLYRASNLGSVIGLLGYPLVVERELTLQNQGLIWSVSYGLLIVLVFASAVMLWRSSPATPETREEEAEPLAGDPVSGGGSSQTAEPPLAAPGLTEGVTVWRRLRWVGLTFVPSSMMLGVTAFITTDITPIPLLWVAPLSLYLFSFVIVFSPSQRMPDLIHKIMVGALPLMMAVLVITILMDMRDPFYLFILLHLLGFFVVAMVLHGEVARDRPPARHLTEFYLWIAVGGVLGGVFNAVIAPVAFNTVIEYQLAIVLACLFVPGLVLSRLLGGAREEQDASRGSEERQGSERSADGEEHEVSRNGSGSGAHQSSSPRWLGLALDVALPVVVGLAIVALGWAVDQGTFDSLNETINSLLGSAVLDRSVIWSTVIGLGIGVSLWFAYSESRPIRFGLAIAAIVLAVSFAEVEEATLFEDRSFFGVYRVSGDEDLHTLVFGSTNHGAQIFGTETPVPTTYYHSTGPIGQVFDALPEDVTSRPAVIGLGTGTMSCYNKPSQRMTFYEIDPLIEGVARNENLFTYLRDCPGEKEVVLGDARLSMAEAPNGSYGVIVADAFSSDAIPVHLMTREAIDMYFDKLQDNGVLAIHISNRHLELEPVLGNVAQDAGLTCRAQYDTEQEGIPGKFVSHWVVMTREEGNLGGMADDERWRPCDQDSGSAVWTDDYSNLLSTFQWN
ncbi:MAG: fused MFS/spermidine synthase, partial [Rubrobacter sp.]|nr:fused MFS/spermidine synthase [Rubrobacter sp.]